MIAAIKCIVGSMQSGAHTVYPANIFPALLPIRRIVDGYGNRSITAWWAWWRGLGETPIDLARRPNAHLPRTFGRCIERAVELYLVDFHVVRLAVGIAVAGAAFTVAAITAAQAIGTYFNASCNSTNKIMNQYNHLDQRHIF